MATNVYDGLNPREIWVGDLGRGSMSRLQGDGALNAGPIWTADGSRIAFTSRRDGGARNNIYWMNAEGGAVER